MVTDHGALRRSLRRRISTLTRSTRAPARRIRSSARALRERRSG